MAWNPDKKLLQLQVSDDFKKKIEELAKKDTRTVPEEIVWLINQGIIRRSKMYQYADEHDNPEGKPIDEGAKQNETDSLEKESLPKAE
jgi:hypothetical protein